MTKHQYQQIIALVKSASPEVILRAASHCDGHTILDPKAFTEAGLPPEVADHLTTIHRSDGSPKGTIFVDGHATKELSGVYGLDALRFFANALGVEYRRAFGRGTEAANIRSALRQHFQSAGDKPAI